MAQTYAIYQEFVKFKVAIIYDYRIYCFQMMDLDGLDENVQFGSCFKETETSLAEDTVFINHGAYGVVPKRVAAAQRR